MKRICQGQRKMLLLGLALLLTMSACGQSVEKLQSEGDVQGLIRILEDQDEKGYRKKDAALALGEIGGDEAVEPLIRYMQECAVTMSSQSSNDEWQACFDASEPVMLSLANMGGSKVFEFLITMLDDEEMHEESVKALTVLNDPQAILPLISTLDHALGKFDDVEERWVDISLILDDLAPNAKSETFESVRDALPGLRNEEDDCRKYKIALNALSIMPNSRVESVLLSRLKTYDSVCDSNLPSMIAEFYDYDPVKLMPFIKQGYPSDFASIYYHLTPAPKPIEVDFTTIYDYSHNTQVTITGRLSLSSVVVCDPDCNVLLENPSNSAEKIDVELHLQSQMDGLRNPYENEDLRVHMDNGDVAGYQSLVRITGTISEHWASPVICDVTKIEPAE